MMDQKLKIVFSHESTDAVNTWQLVSEYLKDINADEDEYKVIEKLVPFEKILDHLSQRGGEMPPMFEPGL